MVQDNLQSKMQEQLASSISGLFESVISSRGEYYKNNPERIQNESNIPKIIRSYTQKNATISGAASLIPGPLGMLAVIPELVTVIRNQITMIYDIGQAHGKGAFLTKELLAGIFLTGLGASATSLLVLHGGKVLVKRASLRAFQKVIALLAGRITQRALKSTISKWLPVVGATAMAGWSAYSTNQIGKKANEIFSQDITLESDFVSEDYDDSSIEDDTVATEDVQPVTQTTKTVSNSVVDPEITTDISIGKQHSLDVTKIHSLIQLMKIDGVMEAEEKQFILAIIKNAKLKPAEIKEISRLLKMNSKFNIDYSIFKDSPEDAISLLIDLTTLAYRDGNFHITEKMYIKQVGRLLGFSDSDIEEIILSIA